MDRERDSAAEPLATPDGESVEADELASGESGATPTDPGAQATEDADRLAALEADQDVDAAGNPQQLVAVEPGAVRSVRPKRKEVAKKEAATPRRRRASAVAVKRTTPAQFARESVDELKKVNWPTALQVRQYYLVVLVFVLVIIAFVGVLDVLFGIGLLRLFG